MTLHDRLDAVLPPDEPPRCYIGASVAGNACPAFLALHLRGFPDSRPNMRLQRIFTLGHAIEALVLDDLDAAGVLFAARDPVTGQQFEYVAAGGHVRAHVDGLIFRNGEEPAVLEIKSMNNASFKKLERHGVRDSHPQYYDQMQLCMGLAKIEDGYLLAYNKNTSAYLSEHVLYDHFHFSGLMVRITEAMGADVPRIAASPEDWRCQGCFKKDACWLERSPTPNCRACKHSLPVQDHWHCTLLDARADKVCPDFVAFQPMDKSND